VGKWQNLNVPVVVSAGTALPNAKWITGQYIKKSACSQLPSTNNYYCFHFTAKDVMTPFPSVGG
jgi:hypothetical protein